MGIDEHAVGSALKKEKHLNFPVRDEVTGEVVSDPDGFPIAELEADDYFELADTMTIEERSKGERSWRFGHVIIDEAQDLTPMQWRMIGRRARGHSMTIVGDVAQRTIGETGSWEDLLPSEFGDIERFDLSTNYRSPDEVTPFAAKILSEVDPTLSQPVAIRSSGHAVETRRVEEVETSAISEARRLADELDGGTVAILSVDPIDTGDPRIRVHTPSASKGMEFDGVVVVEPAQILEQPHGLGLLYVAITRTTERLVILHERELPAVLASPARTK